MSELEIQKRQEYKRNRRKWMIVQIVALAVVAAIALGALFVYARMNRTYYIEYTESSNIDYHVQYKDNNFFESEWIEKDQTYISSLINGIKAEFNYQLNMDTNNVGFDYTYTIDAQLLVADKDSGNAYYTTSETLVPLTKASTIRSNTISISEKTDIDYTRFNEIARTFVDTYNLQNASCTLIVTLHVDVLSSCDTFEQSNENSYSTALSIPLIEDSFSIEVTAGAPETESKVLACSGASYQKVFMVIGIVASVLAVLQAIGLVVFHFLTKNEDITYTAKVRKLVSAYRSYIQQMEGDFDDTGYQTIFIKTFTEMLGIRDTIQSPILMTENRDETMTRFLIPTNTKILYVFEIKVENYDDIYAQPIILADDVDAEALAEAMEQPDVILSDIEFVQDDDDEYAVAPDEPGVEVIGVVWPEKAHKNKVYRYDPNGEELHEGDMVLVPTRDAAQDKEIIRKAAVAHGNHRVDPEHIKHPLKKIIGIIKRRTTAALTSDGTNSDAPASDDKNDPKGNADK